MQKNRVVIALLLFAAACGGGGGGGSGNAGQRAPTVLYVRAGGSDAHDGRSPEQALGSVRAAIQQLRDGDMVIVGPGTYSGMLEIALGNTRQPRGVVLLGDPTGTLTNDPPGDVLIDAAGAAAAFRVSRSREVTIEGFRISGATDEQSGAGILFRDQSDGGAVRHCVLSGNRDALRLQNSSDALIFNNLIADNSNRGIRVADGARRTRIIHNTIANNGNRGIDIGGANQQGVGSTHAWLRNNILQNNRNPNLFVATEPTSALPGFDADYNLVFQAGLPNQQTTYVPPAIAGAHDVNLAARFANPGRGDYRLDPARSPAIDAGTDIDADLRDELLARSTTRDGLPDIPPLDLGYHFPVPGGG